MLKQKQIFHEEHKRTANYDLRNMPGQSLIVYGTVDTKFQTYCQTEFFVRCKYVNTMYNFIVMMYKYFFTSDWWI